MNYIEAIKLMVADENCVMTRGQGSCLYCVSGNALFYSDDDGNSWHPEQRAWVVDALATDWRTHVHETE